MNNHQSCRPQPANPGNKFVDDHKYSSVMLSRCGIPEEFNGRTVSLGNRTRVMMLALVQKTNPEIVIDGKVYSLKSDRMDTFYLENDADANDQLHVFTVSTNVRTHDNYNVIEDYLKQVLATVKEGTV